MSVINSIPLIAAGDDGYQISRSMRLRQSASAYLNRTSGTPTNKDVWTYSGWVKYSTGKYCPLFYALSGSFYEFFEIDNTGAFFWITRNSAGTVFKQYYTAAGQRLFRDPSAWYHFVVRKTSALTLQFYVNGEEFALTAQTVGSPSSSINTASTAHYIGYEGFGAAYADCYLTEVNFIDGQALTPSSFGETAGATGVWKPKKYAGTYGTNGFYLPFTGASPYYSGYFDGTGDYVTAPASSNWDFGSGDFTVEFWVNPSDLSIERKMMFHGWSGSGNYNYGWATGFAATSGILNVYANGIRTFNDITLSVNQWQHIAIVGSGGVLSAFKNGVKSATTHSYTSIVARPTATLVIGGWNDNNEQIAERLMFIGYMSNVRILKGTALYTSTFTPPTSQLTAITNTQFLSLQNSSFVDNSANAATITVAGDARMSQLSSPFSSTGIGSDFSGQGNNWTPNNISLTAGVTYDSMLDVPTMYADGGNGRGNYCTFNPLITPAVGSMTDGNMVYNRASYSSVTRATGARGTQGVSSGKFYFELEFTAIGGSNGTGGVSDDNYGVVSVTAPADTGADWRAYSLAWLYNGDGSKSNGSTVSYGSGLNQGDIVGVALDMDNGKIWFSKNGTWQASGDPVAGTNAAYTNLAGNTLTPLVACYHNNLGGTRVRTLNCGQRPFAYTPPTGFKALNTQNLPDATIKKGNAYFDVKTYTGNGTAIGTTQNITGLSLQPDLVWIKDRSNGVNPSWSHYLVDSVRGINANGSAYLCSNETSAEVAANSGYGITALNSDGFSLKGNGTLTNTNGDAYVSWNWKESASAGFDIVTQTLGTTGINTMSHNLGVAPKMILAKARSWVEQWLVYHASGTTQSQYLGLNTTAAAALSTNLWGSSALSSSQFYFNGTSGVQYVFYLFADVAGYSKFGSYTGNGSADGPFVYLGFRPRFVMYKRNDSTGDWTIIDTARSAYNVQSDELYPSSNIAETAAGAPRLDSLSNGFKIRNAGGAAVNASGGTYIYAAFAENPFKNSLAR